MDFIDLEELETDRNFWYAILSIMYLSAIGQIALGGILSGIGTLGMAVAFTSVAYQKLNEE